MQHWIAEPWLGALVVIAALSGVWICAVAGRALAVADHVGIVWDEMAAMWLLLWLLPDNIWVAVAALVLFRIFDTTKPPPIAWLDGRYKGGLGVMLDDWVAALYAGVLVGIGWYLILSIWQGVT
jgi:phosphatidylglycerophosphatase A